MGLFGLSTTEAIILAQKYNKADNERNEQRIRAINKQTEEIKKHNQELLKSEKEKVSEMNREARQLEPFIILTDFDYGWKGETISIRPSDIKVMNGKIKESEYDDYNNPAPWGGWYKRTTKEPYTELQLWDGRKIKVKESVQDVQNKVNEVIERMVNLQAKVLANTLQNQ
jgi:uncharacterized protein YlzI (FlbEa/FlbD family)